MIPTHTKAELNSVALLAQQGDPRAAESLATMMRPYVVSFFRRKGTYRFPNYDREQRDEMTQHAWLGVWTALKKFDPDKGTKFSTYAHEWMRHEVMEYIAKNSGSLPVSRKAWHFADLVEKEWRENNPDDPRQIFEVPRAELAEVEVTVVRKGEDKTLTIDSAADTLQARKSSYEFDPDDKSRTSASAEDEYLDTLDDDAQTLQTARIVAEGLLELPEHERLQAAEDACESLGWDPSAAPLLLEMT